MTFPGSSHSSMSKLLTAALLIPILAACGSSAPSVSTKPSGSAGTSVAASASAGAGTARPTEAPTLAPTDSPEPSPAGPVQLLACDPAGPGWPASALDRPTDAETGTTAAAQALVAYIAGVTTTQLPESGWRELYRSKTLALYEHDVPDGLLVATVRATNGVWSGESAGPCQPRTWLGTSLSIAATWKLSVKTSASSTTLKVIVTERACASGTSAKGRIAKPRITYDADRVVITIGVTPLTGKQSCTANPGTRLTVTLSEPLGDRELYDGGPFPELKLVQPK